MICLNQEINFLCVQGWSIFSVHLHVSLFIFLSGQGIIWNLDFAKVQSLLWRICYLISPRPAEEPAGASFPEYFAIRCEEARCAIWQSYSKDIPIKAGCVCSESPRVWICMYWQSLKEKGGLLASRYLFPRQIFLVPVHKPATFPLSS